MQTVTDTTAGPGVSATAGPQVSTTNVVPTNEPGNIPGTVAKGHQDTIIIMGPPSQTPGQDITIIMAHSLLPNTRSGHRDHYGTLPPTKHQVTTP